MNTPNENDIKVTPIAQGIRLYANADLTHGIVQLVTEQAAEETMPAEGDHVIAQVAFLPDQLRVMAEQLASLADHLEAATVNAANEAPETND